MVRIVDNGTGLALHASTSGSPRSRRWISIVELMPRLYDEHRGFWHVSANVAEQTLKDSFPRAWDELTR